MDKIKIFCIIFILTGLIEIKGQLKFIDKQITMVINPNWTNDSLKISKEKLKKYNINFNYSNVKYNNKGKLQCIEIEVNCNDGFKGSASTEQLNKFRFGFFRNYNTFTIIKFRVGTLD